MFLEPRNGFPGHDELPKRDWHLESARPTYSSRPTYSPVFDTPADTFFDKHQRYNAKSEPMYQTRRSDVLEETTDNGQRHHPNMNREQLPEGEGKHASAS